MDKDVSHPDDFTPRKLRIAGSDLGRDLLGRLADDFQGANDGLLGFLVCQESVFRETVDECSHLLGGLEHVL